MLYVILAAICSVLVSVLLKLARRYDFDVAQAIGWNYLAAFLLCWGLLKPSLASLSQPGTPWFALLGLAVVLPSLFLVLSACVRRAGIVLSDMAQRLSLLLSLLAAFFLLGEVANTLKLLGLGLGLLAVLGMLARPGHSSGDGGGRVWPLLLTVWGGFALVDVMLKQIAAAGTPFSASLQLCFGLAFLGMGIWLSIRAAGGRGRLTLRNALAGFVLGSINFGNIYFYVQAHRALGSEPAVVFATMNIGVVALGAIVGVAVFGERLSTFNRVAIGLAILAIMLISISKQG